MDHWLVGHAKPRIKGCCNKILRLLTAEEHLFRKECTSWTATLLAKKVGRLILRGLSLGLYNGDDHTYMVAAARERITQQAEHSLGDLKEVPFVKSADFGKQPKVTKGEDFSDCETLKCSLFRRMRTWAMCARAMKISMQTATTYTTFDTLVEEHRQAFIPTMYGVESELKLSIAPNDHPLETQDLREFIANRIAQEFEVGDEEDDECEADETDESQGEEDKPEMQKTKKQISAQQDKSKSRIGEIKGFIKSPLPNNAKAVVSPVVPSAPFEEKEEEDVDNDGERLFPALHRVVSDYWNACGAGKTIAEAMGCQKDKGLGKELQ